MSEIPVGAPAGADADFEDLFQHAPCAYLTLAPNGRIARANRTLEEWLAADPGTLDGRPLRDLLTVPGRIFYETNIAPALRMQRELEEIVLDLIDPDGAKLPVLVSARARTSGDRLVETRMIMVRARERRGYERDLQGREAAAVRLLNDERSSSELREQFIAVLGHDLRNPLASIVGATRLLRREVTSEKSLRVLQMTEVSVDRMAGLIDDVMDFARGRLGSGIAVQREIVLLEPVLRHVVAELEIDQPSRVFVCDFALDEPVSLDERRISQLVSNLLGNALAHGDPRGPVRLSAFTGKGVLTLSVCNSGSPIPPAAMERLFQPFFRGEVRDSRQGLGLGLHIASEIAKAHHGALSVRSDETETCFTLVMPCSPLD